MAATALTVQRVILAGVTPSAETSFDDVNGMVVNNNDGKIWLECTSTHATNTITLEIDTPGTVGAQGLAIAQDSHTIPANGAQRRYGPFPVDVYGSAINLAVTGTGTLTISAWRVAS